MNFWPDDKQGICHADTLLLLSVHSRLEKRSQVTVNWQQTSPQETGMPKTDNNSLLSQIDTIAR
ncbi:hypothetical protein NLN89_08835, partial [Citrobacter portucalensis]|uniref:hypothetical protein n=1 Tax=Citrobacter portucalensis TaxID=1639133 RepID=UPI00226BAEA7